MRLTRKSLLRRVKTSIDRKMLSNHRMVDFIICGTQKGGTAALNKYLDEHSQVCMADKKEVHFFDDESFFLSSQLDYSHYHVSFRPKDSHKLIGEATPIYMYWWNSPRRMWEYNPRMKLIVLLRNPIERAYSHWNMEVSKKADSLSFWEAIQTEEERCREALPLQHRVYSYVSRGFYLEQLRRLWSYFPKEQVLILKNEHLKYETAETLDKVCRFLEIENMNNVKSRDIYSHPYKSKINDREKSYLKNIYEHEIKALENLLGWDCCDWLVC